MSAGLGSPGGPGGGLGGGLGAEGLSPPWLWPWLWLWGAVVVWGVFSVLAQTLWRDRLARLGIYVGVSPNVMG